MPYKDPIKQKEYHERYRANNKDKKKEYYEKNKEINKEKEKKRNKERYEKNKEQVKETSKEYRETNKDQINEKKKEYHTNINQHVYDSIIIGEINERRKWDLWCDSIKSNAKTNKHPYSDDFTNDIMFEMMVQGCFYCGDIATTIDRIDSILDHTPDNCVGCCKGCNISKGIADPSTFIRKAYYRVCGKYYDDDIDIWFVHKNKPIVCDYKRRAKKKDILFDLSNEVFDELTKGECEYCHRSPTTWFGIDRVSSSQGYVIGNVVSCCWDCNVDKLNDDIDTMISRNERIATRMDGGELVIKECEKVILRNRKII